MYSVPPPGTWIMSAGALRPLASLLRASRGRSSRWIHEGRTPHPLSLSPRLGVKLGFRPAYCAPLRYEYIRVPILGLRRWYSKDQGDGEGKEVEEQEDAKEAEEEEQADILEDEEPMELLPLTRHQALAALNVPKDYPDVPLLPISRSPIFPRLARMMEVRRCENLTRICRCMKDYVSGMLSYLWYVSTNNSVHTPVSLD